MPLKLNIGSSKKIGLPNYSSQGASINLELEVDSSLIGNPDALQEQIESLFHQAREAVETELSRAEETADASQNGQPLNGNGQDQASIVRRATDGQVRALHAITNRLQIDLYSLLDRLHQVGRPEDLTLQEASQLIDELNRDLDQLAERQ